MNTEELKLSVNVLIKHLKEDPEYYRYWKDNIANQKQDYFNNFKQRRNNVPLTQKDIWEVSNEAASKFLNILIK